MIYLITGVPGAGKTLYSIGLIREFLKAGREVFADIDGLRLDGVLPSPDDWREAPEGAVVVYDECQRRYGAEGMRGGRSENEQIAAMETHRHTGHDLVLITQHPNLLHAHVRRLVGRHHHVFRLYGSKVAKVFTMDRLMKVDSHTDLKQADVQQWTYPKKDFGAYQSATVHTHKLRLPRWLAWGVGAMALAAVASITLFQSSGLFKSSAAEASEPPSGVYYETEDAAPPLPGGGAPPASGDSPRRLLGGCVATALACQCYDRDLLPIDWDEATCRATAAAPLTFRPAGVEGRALARPTPAGAAF